MPTAAESIARLRAGNARYLAHAATAGRPTSPAARAALVAAQEPFAAIISCADSRVPLSLIFDQGPGDIFGIRVAGNIIAPMVLGSIEFAAFQLQVPLLLVLGHTCCGAVEAALDPAANPAAAGLPHLQQIVDHIRPNLLSLHDPSAAPTDSRLRAAELLNVRAEVARLRQAASLQPRLSDGRLTVAGAIFDIGSGAVTYLDDPR